MVFPLSSCICLYLLEPLFQLEHVGVARLNAGFPFLLFRSAVFVPHFIRQNPVDQFALIGQPKRFL